MIFIIGIRHTKQVGESKEPIYIATLESGLLNLIKEKSVTIIAEEFSIQVQNRDGQTPAQKIAIINNLKYIFADPDEKEREKLGIKLRWDTAKNLGIDINDPYITKEEINKINIAHRHFDGLREKEWLKRIRDDANSSLIFICGIDHLKTFCELLNQQGFEACIHEEY